jgi:hypothetical protein
VRPPPPHGSCSQSRATAWANTGAIVFLYFRGERTVPAWEIVVPLIALAIIFYVLYQNTLADSLVYPYTVFPLVVAGWLVLGLLIIFLVPGLATRIGEGLAREEGLRARGRPPPPE